MSTLMVEAGTEFPSAEAPGRPPAYAFLAVIERGATGWGAYVPDLPGVVAAADTEDEIRLLISAAVEFHLDGLREENEPVPAPVSHAVWVAP